MITDYNISFNTWLTNLVQWFDAGDKIMAWLRVLISPIKDIHTRFLAYRIVANREASYNGQVMVLERMLNLQYYDVEAWASPGDVTAGGRIYIDHVGNTIPISFIYYGIESQPSEYDYYGSEGQPSVYDFYGSEYLLQNAFIVKVPVALTYTESEMRSRIDSVIQSGYNYTIQTY